ncbi:heterokaryon incompatibility protein [Colletotrichum scovillei]|uniref:Heterokaryon incompatibility protein n=2 Tax=Colletotrichum scovillei TaxID=1209932 RepID=A0A9P7UAI3_9PEZI|nr:heterokaryon incompatibility protein [Colletotrichum scovillei]KAG7059583.1 heterokaryon incompatibility protein [Colletotrichum scovillei]KAG7067041.1 heterokaryon incompatibility protein [Colletotrichum scovillei]
MSSCQDCRQLDLADLVDEECEVQDVILHSSVADLERNVTACDLCQLFYTSITEKLRVEGVSVDQEAWNDTDSPVILRGIQYTDEKFESRGLFWVKVRCDRLSPRAYCYFSFYPKDETARLENSILGRPIKPPAKQLSLVKNWVRECEDHHQSCHSAPATLPTRVVDVGVEGVMEPRLVVTSGEVGRYMTLSHCWGLHPVIRTTSETINDHIKSLPMSKLPPTFRDAVLITRSLGVQYLWIDCLCIVQDSQEDWELESVKMGTIYASSCLTIAASASADSTGGCFLPRSTSNHVQVKCTRKSNNESVSIPVFLRPRPRDFSHLPQSILHSRAWVTQERLLSARIVHYDSDQLLWECRESRLAEDGVPTDAFAVQKLVWDERLHLSYPFAQGRLSTSEFVWDWYDMVSAYSRRGITKSYDRLPALSGLAKVMEECTGQRYLAGLWKNHLHYGLLWRRSEYWLETPSGGFRAPSWSWASLEGAVMMPEIGDILPSGNEMEVVVRITQAETTPLGLDPRGMLRSGYLQLEGKLRLADPRETPEAPGFQRFSTYRKELAIDFLKENGIMVGLAVFDKDYCGNNIPLYYLQVSRRVKEPSRWYGLLLEATSQPQEFRRVGFCRTEEYPLRDWFAHVAEGMITIV